MALLKLEPQQIAALWDSLAPEIAKTMIPTGDDSSAGINSILAKLLTGEMRMWILAKNCEVDLEKNTCYGHLTTIPVHDWGTGSMNLLIYSLYSWQLIPDDIAVAAMNSLREYAKGLGCRKIIAYTVEPRVEQLAKLTGLSVTYKFIEGSV